MGNDKETAASVPTCPICQTGLSRHGLVLCRKCSTPHHRRCWSYNKGCGVYACECRVLVVPPASEGEDEDDPRLSFSRQLGYLDDRSGGLMAAMVLGLFFYQPYWIVPALLAFLLPSLLQIIHTINTGTGQLERRIRLGPLTVWRRSGFVALSDVDCLELRRIKPGDAADRSNWEVWLRDRRERAVLLEVTKLGTVEAVLKKLEFPSTAMDTVVSLPRTEGVDALPSGLADTLDDLPDD